MKAKHIHKYVRVKLGRAKTYEVYKCALPGCSHFVIPPLVVGRLSLCWRCGLEFVITEKLLFKKPHCENCTNHRTKKLTDEKVLAGLKFISEVQQ